MRDVVRIESAVDPLCPACGLCCNGVLFRDVELHRADRPERLRSLGVRLEPAAGQNNTGETRGGPPRQAQGWRIPQPCPALCEDGHCRLYIDRPSQCRQFECLVLKAVAKGRRSVLQALELIHQARHAAGRVRELLRLLGDTEESLALSLRFHRMQAAFAQGAPNGASAVLYGELTVAVHELNLLLRDGFYR